MFIDDLQRHLSGDNQAHVRRTTMQRLGNGSDCLRYVLGVVERDQQLERRQRINQGLQRVGAGTDRHTERSTDDAGHSARLGSHRQVDETHPMAMQVALPEQQRLGEARLADTSRTRDADEAKLADKRGERHEIAVAADQRRQNRRQVRLQRRGDNVRRRRLCGGRRRIDVRDEAIAKPRHGLDRVRAEQFAQCRDLLLDVVLFYHHVRPHDVHQLLLADESAVPLGEKAQQVECAGAESGGIAVDQQAPLARLQFETPSEAQGGVCRSAHPRGNAMHTSR